MPGFRYVCQFHRDRFAAAIAGHGLDAEGIEDVRCALLAWLAENYPAMVLDHFNRKSFLGCGLNEASIDLAPMYRAIGDAVARVKARRASAAAAR